MNKEGLILINLGQFKEKIPLNSIQVQNFLNGKMPTKTQKGQCVRIPRAIGTKISPDFTHSSGVSITHVEQVKKKLYGPLLWMGFNYLKTRATSRRQFTFYFFPGTHFIDLRKMKG